MAPTPGDRVAPDAARTRRARAAVVVLAVATVLFIASSLANMLLVWQFPDLKPSDGTLIGAIGSGTQPRLVTMFIGVAARDAGGGKASQMTAPKELGSLKRFDVPKGGLDPYSAYFLQQMTGFGLKQRDYDPVLSAAQIDQLTSGNRVARYPMDVVAIVGPSPDGRVSLFTDEGHTAVYVISTPLLAEEVRP